MENAMKILTSTLAKSLMGLMALSLVLTGCTKKRNPALPDADAPNIFAISDFGDVQDIGSPYSMKTDSKQIELNQMEAPKAENEQGKALVDSVQVPANLKFMFDDLKVSAQANAQIPVTFAVDRSFVTVYKITNDLSHVSALERQYAQLREEVVLNKKMQRLNKKTERQALTSKLQSLAAMRMTRKGLGKDTVYLIPLFKYEIQSYGVLERKKNEMHEETSTLELRKTDWSEATHIQIKALRDESAPVAIAPDDRDKLDRTFSTASLNNQLMTAGDLRSIYQVPTALNDQDVVLTSLDTDGMTLYQVTQTSKLSPTQKKLIQTGTALGKLASCPADVKKRVAVKNPEIAAECVMIKRYTVPVAYVQVKLPVKDTDGNESPTIRLDEINYVNNAGLVMIPVNVQPNREQADDIYDSASMLRVMDIKGKEFFFRRTLEDAPLTTTFMVGEAGGVDLVRFEMQDTKLIVRRADNLIKFESGNNSQEVEDVMSIPVTYIRRDLKDARGNDYVAPHYVTANKDTAEYLIVNWSENHLPASNSPLAYYGGGACLNGANSPTVQEVDNRMDKGVLNFSYQYSTALTQSEACVGIYSGVGTYGLDTQTNQYNARLKERISFKLNDGSTDKSPAPQTPFRVQNALGYGVWTLGRIAPDAHGLYGREGQQQNLPVIQDFRNGKVLVYTITGLENLDSARRQLNLETAREIIAAWNEAYKKAFAGTELARSGDYLQIQVSGENGVSAHIGDLDKNIIHFENKVNDNHGTLGVSQVGVNYRSGLVVADSLIVFAGNLEKYVASLRRGTQYTTDYKALVEGYKRAAIAKMTSDQKNQDDVTKALSMGSATPVKGADTNQWKSTQNILTLLSKNKQKPLLSPSHPIQLSTLTASQKLSALRAAQVSLAESSRFKFAPAENESAYLDRVLSRLSESADFNNEDVEGLVAQEMLKSMGTKLTAEGKASLQRRAGLMLARQQMRAHFATKTGCLFTVREGLGRNFVEGTFEEAYKRALHFDLAHEMGHSQGLTHNFIGSFDKNNFRFKDEAQAKALNDQIKQTAAATNANPNRTQAEVDSTNAKITQLLAQIDALRSTNYSSIMDYIDPTQFMWGGIGNYDVAALRGSQLGLFELTPEGLQYWNKNDPKAIVQGQFIHVNSIKKFVDANKDQNFKNDQANQKSWQQIGRPKAKSFSDMVQQRKAWKQRGWSDFTAKSLSGMIHTYKYCTDIDVGYEPTCQRFDLGTSPQEIVQNLIQDYNEQYAKNYYAWDRLDFGMAQRDVAISGTIRTMLSMRQFLDELFYKAIYERDDQVTISNYAQATMLSYFFLNQVIHIPDADSNFTSADRFVAQPIKGTDGKTEIEIVEKKALLDRQISKLRFDTIGIEDDKVFAMRLLTLRGLSAFKYSYNTIEFSYLEFEKYFIGRSSEESVVSQTLSQVLTNNLQPTVTNFDRGAILVPVTSTTSTSSSTMRSYAGISAVLSLQSTTLDEKDNFANLFKVGSSNGAKAPTDRVALANLGVANDSSARVSYWPLDNALYANDILTRAAKMNFFIQKQSIIQPLMENMVHVQLNGIIAQATGKTDDLEKAKADTVTARTALVAKLNELNSDHMIATADANDLSVDNQVDTVILSNQAFLVGGLTNMARGSDADLKALASAAQAGNQLANVYPLFAVQQKALLAATDGFIPPGANKDSDSLGKVLARSISGSQTETNYGLFLRMVQFLNRLTLMTNPEYAR